MRVKGLILNDGVIIPYTPINNLMYKKIKFIINGSKMISNIKRLEKREKKFQVIYIESLELEDLIKNSEINDDDKEKLLNNLEEISQKIYNDIMFCHQIVEVSEKKSNVDEVKPSRKRKNRHRKKQVVAKEEEIAEEKTKVTDEEEDKPQAKRIRLG